MRNGQPPLKATIAMTIPTLSLFCRMSFAGILSSVHCVFGAKWVQLNRCLMLECGRTNVSAGSELLYAGDDVAHLVKVWGRNIFRTPLLKYYLTYDLGRNRPTDMTVPKGWFYVEPNNHHNFTVWNCCKVFVLWNENVICYEHLAYLQCQYYEMVWGYSVHGYIVVD